MPELWIPIKNYDNYNVSNMGNIRNTKTGRVLKYYIRNGYKSVTLSKSNIKKTVNIHTIVAEHFLEKPEGRFVVNHKNENKLDNEVTNLEYVTYKENTMYSMNTNRSRNSAEYDLAEFTDIPGYSNYQISKMGSIYSKKIKQLCRITILPSGYHKIKLKADTGIYKDVYIHVLVAITYLNYNPTGTHVINHINGIKGSNVLDNLEIVTQKENMIHSVNINNHKIYRRAVYYIDSSGNTVSYSSAKEACAKTGIDNSSILKSCKSDKLKAGNIKWYYMSNS